MKGLIYLFNINTFFLYTDAFDPLFPISSLSQDLNLMDRFLDNPFLPAASRGAGASIARRGFDVKEDENGLFICMGMPGLSKEDAKVTVEKNTRVIKDKDLMEGEADKSGRRRCSSRLELPSNLYRIDGIKGEMKNGVFDINVRK